MEFLEAGSLTNAGRADLADGETQVATASGVAILDSAKQPLAVPGATKGHAAVTTHFIWWWPDDRANGAPIKLGLQRILKAEAHKSIFRREPRIDLYFAKDPSRPLVRLVFSGNECSEFFERLQTSISRQGWKAPKVVVKRESENKTHFAGVGGVMRRQEQTREQTRTLATDAFSDLSVLLQSASEIVSLADRFSAAVRQKQERSSDANPGSEEREFFALLNDMGIANPATKRACGSRYHEELARELSDFLARHLKRHSKSGVIALTDLYCLVNRARGTELISPNDLYQACTMMEPLGLDHTLRTFPSGVAVLQSRSLSDEEAAKSLLAMLGRCESSEQPYLTPLLVAQELSLSLQLAMEQLKAAEGLGHLCRDETLQGVAFYRNRFSSVELGEAGKVRPAQAWA